MPNKHFRTFPLRNEIEYAFLRIISALINALPIEIATGIARTIGTLLYYVVPKRKKIMLENLNIAFKDQMNLDQKKQLSLECFKNLSTSIMEFFRTPAMLKEAAGRFEFEGTEHMDAAFAKGKGVVFAISHIGSWEYLGFLPYLKKYPCSVIVRPIKNPYIFQWIQKLRQETGLNPIDKNNSVKEILRRLKNNELVAILMDQWAGNDGIWIPFFEKETSSTSVPARLAKRNGSVIIPGYCYRVSVGRYKIVLQPEVPIEGSEDYERITTQKLNSILEREIKKHPTQWTWGHKRWKTKRP